MHPGPRLFEQYGYGGVCRYCTHTLRVDTVIIFFCLVATNITSNIHLNNVTYTVSRVNLWIIMSRRKRKLFEEWIQGCSQGTCVVPMHAPQTSSLLRGVGEVDSACEVGWRGRVQPRPLWKLAKGCKIGGWYELCKGVQFVMPILIMRGGEGNAYTWLDTYTQEFEIWGCR